MANQPEQLAALSRAIRHRILTMTSEAESGHPTSSLSATDLLVALLFGGTFRADLDEYAHPANDRLIFSKGHASPLFYALYATAGVISDDELLTYRQAGSRLEGHPRPVFEWAEAATGSLGQGLSVGCGMQLAARLDGLPYRTFVLLGDSEMAEGSNWEAIMAAGVAKLGGLVGLLDLNRLGQRGETMFGRDVDAYAARLRAFGWQVVSVDGHDQAALQQALAEATATTEAPVMIIASTVKGKGVPFWEDQEGWHGKPLPADRLSAALAGLGEVDLGLRGQTAAPPQVGERVVKPAAPAAPRTYPIGEEIATRTAFGNALKRLGDADPALVVLDPEVGNSTMTEMFREAHPDRYIETYIAEQHTVGASLGLSRRGKKPVAATFAAFWTRAHDQIRMSRYSDGNITFVGSHAGASIGPDGPSQMGLEDIALFRSVPGAVVLYPGDAISAEALTELAVAHHGISYLRTTRGKTPVLYEPNTKFMIGGSETLRISPADAVTVISAGITLHEVLRAADELKAQGTAVRVIDAYSIAPIDQATLRKAADETKAIITVEDHYAVGGLGDAVRTALADHPTIVRSLAVPDVPGSGAPEALLERAEIDTSAIIKTVKEFL